MKKYIVEVFDGIAGESAEFETFEEAKKRFEREVEYHKDKPYEFIELNAYDENDVLIETIMSA